MSFILLINYLFSKMSDVNCD
ncbi:hypothetical protein MTBLM5_110065 [Magnetospirillum sp. LM-5]|nr:hypothetical protein MTBLM5_110065 [Magnetospirillum sp. LM-5]